MSRLQRVLISHRKLSGGCVVVATHFEGLAKLLIRNENGRAARAFPWSLEDTVRSSEIERWATVQYRVFVSTTSYAASARLVVVDTARLPSHFTR